MISPLDVAGFGGAPDVLARHLELVLDPLTPPATHVEAFGSARVRRRVLRRFQAPVPVSWELDLAPGRAFRWDLTLRVRGRPLVGAFAEFRDGRGRFRTGRRPHEGPDVDRSERALLWVWTVAFAPEALLAAPSSAFEPLDDGIALRVSPPEAPHRLRFGDDGLLHRIETERYNLETASPEPWHATLEDYRPYGHLRAPREIATAWGDRSATRLTVTKLIRTPHAAGDAPA